MLVLPADGSAVSAISEHRKRKHSNVESNHGDSFDAKVFNHLLERIADGGEHDLIMHKKALKQERQLAI